MTVNQLVAYNAAFFRRVGGLDQQEFGEPLGWSATSVSAAERSWESKRIKKFDADEIVQIASTLGIPLIALFLPPEDHGTAVRYVLQRPGRKDMDLGDVLARLFPASEGDSPAMDAYRKRLIAAGAGSQADVTLVQAQHILTATERLAGEMLAKSTGTAQRRAEEITGRARMIAEDLERDAHERHREAMVSLVQTREELERRIDELRAFERDYRTRLHAYLVGQIRELWTPDARSEVEKLIEQANTLAADGGGTASIVVFRRDGTYDIVEPEHGTSESEQEGSS